MNPPWSEARLDNGLRVLVQPSAAAPVAAVYLWLECGTADESTPELAGVAHFLEHMVFKGTARRGVGEAAAEIEALGGDLNAYTTWDQTVLHATVAAPYWQDALDVVADMALNPAFDPRELEREKQVVLEEIRGYEDDPDAVADDALQALLYPGHPYGLPILGTVESVARLPHAGVVDFWRRGWAPNRAILAIAGPVDPAEVLEAARRSFQSWQPQQPRAPIPEADRARGRAQRLARSFDSTAVQLGWRIPALGHPDLPALDVLAAVLGQGHSSLLMQRLQLQEGIAASVWADASTRVGGGSLVIGFLPLQEQTGEAVEMALDVTARVARAGLPGAVVARARDALVSDFLFSHETVDGIAHDLAWYAARMGSPAARETWREQLAAVTTADVTRAARTWLTAEHANLVAVDRQLSEDTLKRAFTDGRKRWHIVRGKPRIGEVHRYALKNGVRIVVLPDETEICAIRTLSLGGCLAVPDRLPGIPSAWSSMVTTGAGPWDAQGYGTACDSVATVVDAIAGRNTLGLQASFPVAHLDDAVELVLWPLLDPHFQAWEWDRVKGELQEELRTLDDRPGQVASRKMWALLYPEHPWRHPWSGTLGGLERVTPRALRRWHEQQIQGRNLVVAVVGGVHPEAVRDVLAPWLEELDPGEPLPARSLPPPPNPARRQTRAGHEQATVVACVRGAALTDPDRHALTVAGAILGAQGGRLFLSLREARGLGYSVWASHTEGVDGGVFQAGITSAPDRAREAARGLVSELGRITEEGPTEREVERAVRMLVGQRAMSLQRAVGRATNLAATTLYGLPWGMDAYRKELERIRPRDVREALQARGVGAPSVLTVLPRS